MDQYDIVVIGAGAAGLTAAAFAASQGHKVAVVESKTAGGQVSNIDSIDNFPAVASGTPGYEFGPLLQEQASEAGADFLLDSVESIVAEGAAYVLVLTDEKVRARAVVVAAGSTKRALNVPGEESLRGRGVSQCASCDGPLFRGLHVCVVGGGDAALSEALHLAAHAKQVTVIHRGEAFRAQPKLVERLEAASNIQTLFGTTVEQIDGDTLVTGVVLNTTATGERRTMAADGVFVYIGLVPNTAFVNDLLQLDDLGRIVTDVRMRTSVPGIFAAGDIRSGSVAMLAASAGDGATAAISAAGYLHAQTQ